MFHMLGWKTSGLESWFHHIIYGVLGKSHAVPPMIEKKKANYTLTPNDYYKLYLDSKDVKM